MDATGTLTLGDEVIPVTGDAWFDHQWGDFIAVGAGGWDWFAVNLADGTDITLSLVRDADGGYPLVYGTLVQPDGTTSHLTRDDFEVAVTGHWDIARDRRRLPGGLAHHHPGRGARHRPRADGRGPGAGHPARRRASCTGRGRSGRRRPATGSPSPVRRTWS